MTNRIPVFKRGLRLYQRGKKGQAHWIPEGHRSVCGIFDRREWGAVRVATLAGFLPHNMCKNCLKIYQKRKEQEKEKAQA